MTPLKIVIRLDRQRLYLCRGEEVLQSYPISSSRFGAGCEPGSFKTPLGRFEIAEKVGGDQPLNTVFRGRKPVVSEEPDWTSEPDLITSRILWLNGLEAHNANTKERFIYIHGTNQEALLASPASHGCIRMANADIDRLFNEVEPGTEVVITPGDG
ncbi:MAG: L,D-transpeptidase [Verrucomicrobia bacterium]|nr:L,D-transpeptidase [Verrucomicrobiota bacterium]MBV9999416.1 L,D-transpeptidase [Verrucomicrobiota bacterium]